MSEKESGRVDIDGASINLTGDKGESVKVGPCGVHVSDGTSEVKVTWTGIRVRDGKTHINVSFVKPLVGCGVIVIALIAILTAVIVGIVKLMI